jgi:hypothetical protein
MISLLREYPSRLGGFVQKVVAARPKEAPMRLFRVLRCIAAVCVLIGAAHVAYAVPQQVPFDRTFMVSAPGSTTPVSAFDINGPAPVLYLDLPAPWGQYSSSSSTWFADSSSAQQYDLSGGELFTSAGEFWLSPTPQEWELKKSLGTWHINSNYYWWTLVMVYGVGAPITNATGSATVPFSVIRTEDVGSVVPINPEPGSVLLCGISTSMLLLSRRSRRR